MRLKNKKSLDKMKRFPQKLSVENFEKLKEYRLARDLCKVRRDIYEFMLSNDFIKNITRCVEINEIRTRYCLDEDDITSILERIMEELKTLGWETKLGLQNTMLFIYPPNDVPKLLKYSFEEY